MDINELRKQRNTKILLRAKSGGSKTYSACMIALSCLDEGADVKYVDTEHEAPGTMLGLIENGEFDEDVVENLVYTRVDGYERFKEEIANAEKFDLLVVDPLDHKHSFVLKAVTDARVKADADWNQYPKIYSEEAEIMNDLSKMDTNVLGTLDPESGKDDKTKGAQANIHGYFNIVVDMWRDGDSWNHRIENWVGRSDLIGGQLTNIDVREALTKEVLESIEV